MDKQDAILAISNLTVAFEKLGHQVTGLHGINLAIQREEILGLVGESGCGKSITALSALRLLPEGAKIVSGEIKLDGKNIVEVSEREMQKIRGDIISMIFQEPMTALNPLVTVGRQIEESLILHRKLSSAERHEKVLKLLEAVEISDPETRYKQYPFELSGGMRQRVMIALALACNPKIIVADEPTTALDVTIQAQIIDLLKNIRKNYHTSILLISHNMGVIADIADRVAVMYAGRIVEVAAVDVLFGQPIHPYTCGLLASIPDLVSDRTQDLQSIPGSVPDLNSLPAGCAFQSRCSRATAICSKEIPGLMNKGHEHLVACWNAGS